MHVLVYITQRPTFLWYSFFFIGLRHKIALKDSVQGPKSHFLVCLSHCSYSQGSVYFNSLPPLFGGFVLVLRSVFVYVLSFFSFRPAKYSFPIQHCWGGKLGFIGWRSVYLCALLALGSSPVSGQSLGLQRF